MENDNKNQRESENQGVYTIDSDAHRSDYTRIRNVVEKLDELYSIRNQLNVLTQMLVVGFVETQKRELMSHDIDYINEVYPLYFPKESIHENTITMGKLREDLKTCLNYLPFGFVITSFSRAKAQKAEKIYKELARLEELNAKLSNVTGAIR